VNTYGRARSNIASIPFIGVAFRLTPTARSNLHGVEASFRRDIAEQPRVELRRANCVPPLLAGLSFLILGGLLAWPHPSRANLFSPNGSFPLAAVDRSGEPYSSIALVQSAAPVPPAENSAESILVRGTGFMVSPCYALTAFHVVFGVTRKAPDTRVAQDAWISLGQEGQQGFSYSRLAAKAVRWGDFVHDQSQDWVLLKVANCPGKDPRIGWLALATGASNQLGRGIASTAGFDGAFPSDELVGQTNCYMAHPPGSSMIIHHYCASRPGLSGAPIFTNGPQGAEVQAIASREQNPNSTVLPVGASSYANIATFVPEVLARSGIQAMIEADIVKAGRGGQPVTVG
jgi:hypothetical protein